MVKLEESLGSIEKVLDEYLLSLQVDIDFDKYFTDKKSYNKLRKEKLLKMDESSIITVEEIERKYFETLQKFNDYLNNSNNNSPDTDVGNN
ncbi:hypothetical protein M972_111090 [Acetivibrio thermocellus AD2]|jgi:uncharacterized membrane protein YgaE (UPF0421/DUF939 family)|uniref:Uncharacterized protein n=1 Tax=Acetivibrio thermocellus AD2 TaxID=1138384 RepID=A0AB36TFL5_ACETH|nr:hypothetical protein [Acetivibrio thermocellus]ADU74112.1 hypothetical protein Clo1313_1044 [Acetivibrio thermocellus DSM 1313]ALX08050.1 hypothetical protein AD2_01055 [Acetivibrio thermocellus AD2]ANV75797.1 hypothetical protein LQRI_1056 [Acetivibrio thermocellus DSM 2360]EIC06070.1 hypothetical protein YSBL_0376 [Acetivibrio thermocellus YS]PFH02321.1 hypothetical protein M972_111090 [Acetivibrio thermocellus AD2]